VTEDEAREWLDAFIAAFKRQDLIRDVRKAVDRAAAARGVWSELLGKRVRWTPPRLYGPPEYRQPIYIPVDFESFFREYGDHHGRGNNHGM